MPQLVHALFAVAGVLLALFLPRRKYLGIALAALPLALIAAGGALERTLEPAVAWMAAALGLAAGLAVLVNRLLPRLPLLCALAFIPGLMAGLCFAAAPGSPRWMTFAALGVVLAMAVAGTIFVRIGLRWLWALIGGALVAGGWWFARPLAWLGAAGLLFAANFFTSRFVEYEKPEWGRVARFALALALTVAAGLFVLTMLIPELPAAGAAPPAPCAGSACRLAALAKTQPRGGILWPLPSEAVLWGPSREPAAGNLDALYLGGDARAWPAKLPGTNLFTGRFALNGAVEKMRMVKDGDEVAALKTASAGIAAALRDALPLVKPGGSEGALAREIDARQRAHGCGGESFPPIVAAGRHALDFHYMKNSGAFAPGELAVIDIGCYAGHYASDFTRTLPVSGTFTPEQRKTYSALYDAQQAAARACKPGIKFYGKTGSLDRIARDALKAGGAPSDFKHPLGHPLGLFVHDPFDFRDSTLEPGMVIMIEPGIYDARAGYGMRLEDAYLVTGTGCELLTTGFPADPDSVEQLLRDAH